MDITGSFIEAEWGKVSFCGATDPGRRKADKPNEDTFILQPLWLDTAEDGPWLLATVIDGIGGYEGGATAARLAREGIIRSLECSCGHGERLQLLKTAVASANNAIFEERDREPRFYAMGCVLTACLINATSGRLYMAHVGDTRLYRYPYDEPVLDAKFLQKLSHDHSLVGYREEKGELTEDEAMRHHERNVIGRDVGSEQHNADDADFIEAATFQLNWMPGRSQGLLLCSDGLCDMVTRAEMAAIIQSGISLQERVENLIALANQKGGRDNITVLLVEFPALAPPPGIKDDLSRPLFTRAGDNFARLAPPVPAPPPLSSETSALTSASPAWLKTVALWLAFFLLGGVAGWLWRASLVPAAVPDNPAPLPAPVTAYPSAGSIPITPEPIPPASSGAHGGNAPATGSGISVPLSTPVGTRE